jgi:hypothetical protein
VHHASKTFRSHKNLLLIRHQNKGTGGPGFSFLFFPIFPISWNQKVDKILQKLAIFALENTKKLI